ncbi:MAG: xanthine dehydrogenase family protein molybdopterin-binding subunit [Ilumatobacteraceae bacterium]
MTSTLPTTPRQGSILGTRVLRTEDPELLTGEVRYVADLHLDGALHLVVVRSEMAHATITAIDTADAAAAPGVVAVLTAADLDLPTQHGMAKVHDDFARPVLATGVVRYVGEPIVAIIAETDAQARDAAQLIVVDLAALEAVVDAEAALELDAPLLFPDHGSNIAVEATDPAPADIFGDADLVVRGRYVNQRMAVAAMEPHGVAAFVDTDGRVVVYGSTQMPHMLHNLLARSLRLTPEQVRIITPPVGGGFGGKAGLYPEQTLVAAAALRTGRPVQWIATRSEDLLAIGHSRDQIQYAELGVKHDGTFTAMRVRLVGNAGAYPTVGAFLPGGTKRMAQGTYRLPRMQFDVVVAATNTCPTGPYRGAGRPEATALLERLVDQAALELHIDPVEIRRRNLIADAEFPFHTLSGLTYDSGHYLLPLDTALAAAGYDELRAEQARRRAADDPKLLGIGLATYVEVTAGGSNTEYGAVEIHPDGTVSVKAGTSSHGQGHQTAFAMIVSEHTGIAVDRVRLIAVDTDTVRSGGGTGGSRSLQLGGSAVLRATEAVIDKARRLAAHLLEASVDDIVVDTSAGTVGVAGVPTSSLDWGALAGQALAMTGTADDTVDHTDGTAGLAAQLDFDQPDATFPFGAHVSVVEVDRDTGLVTVVRHIAVDDCGTVLSPLLVQGQQHGGAAAGISQALYEQVFHDADGNPLNSNFLDYKVPSAAEFPMFDVRSTETPTALNPLGAKGIGEASTIGSTPAVQNAVIDALAHLGVRHLDLPCSPESVWRAIRAAEQGHPPEPWREPPSVFDRLVRGQAIDAAGLAAAEGI